jgi:hypothetical protein
MMLMYALERRGRGFIFAVSCAPTRGLEPRTPSLPCRPRGLLPGRTIPLPKPGWPRSAVAGRSCRYGLITDGFRPFRPQSPLLGPHLSGGGDHAARDIHPALQRAGKPSQRAPKSAASRATPLRCERCRLLRRRRGSHQYPHAVVPNWCASSPHGEGSQRVIATTERTRTGSSSQLSPRSALWKTRPSASPAKRPTLDEAATRREQTRSGSRPR